MMVLNSGLGNQRWQVSNRCALPMMVTKHLPLLVGFLKLWLYWCTIVTMVTLYIHPIWLDLGDIEVKLKSAVWLYSANYNVWCFISNIIVVNGVDVNYTIPINWEKYSLEPYSPIEDTNKPDWETLWVTMTPFALWWLIGFTGSLSTILYQLGDSCIDWNTILPNEDTNTIYVGPDWEIFQWQQHLLHNCNAIIIFTNFQLYFIATIKQTRTVHSIGNFVTIGFPDFCLFLLSSLGE